MKIPITLSSGREVFLHREGDPIRPQLEGMHEWIAALRSGNYKQIGHRLHDCMGFCCLGVKRELEGCEWRHVDGAFFDGGEKYYYRGHAGLESEGQFPIGVRISFERWEPDEDNIIPVWDSVTSLVQMNDVHFTFEEIADIIPLIWSHK